MVKNTESRPELSNISFVDFVQDCIVGGEAKYSLYNEQVPTSPKICYKI